MRFPKNLTLLILPMALVCALSAWAQQKPFTQEQVSNMVRDGFGDDSGAKLIEQRGIEFAPAEDFLQTLKAAGAGDGFLQALRVAKHPGPTSAKKPLNQVQIITLVAGGVPTHRVAMLVEERGIDFEPQDDYLQEVTLAGGDEEVFRALKSAKVTKPATVDPATQTLQTEVRQHVARGAELKQKGQLAEAEQEYRAALLLDPQNPNIYVGLAYVLSRQKKWDEAAAAAREALRLNSDDYLGHTLLGFVLEWKGDLEGAITEYREALRLNPTSDFAHARLGAALTSKGDLDGAIREEREALRQNPNYAEAHVFIGNVLWIRHDSDGAITEYREALRLDPKNAEAHADLGAALAHKGDWEGVIAEEREALRLNPNDTKGHNVLGVALANRGDLDGAITEYREALRLNPNYAVAHAGLGSALEKKGDPRGALEEYRAAYTLDPKNATYKRNYDRLMQHVNQ